MSCVETIETRTVHACQDKESEMELSSLNIGVANLQNSNSTAIQDLKRTSLVAHNVLLAVRLLVSGRFRA